MQTPTDTSPSSGHKPRSLLLWGIGTAVMFSSAGGFAALMAWKPASTITSRDALPVSLLSRAKPGARMDAGALPPKGVTFRKAKCNECGSIVSIREARHGEAIPLIVAGGPATENQNRATGRSASREITVRLEDGSSRVITDANPARWRIGERVTVIEGFRDSNR